MEWLIAILTIVCTPVLTLTGIIVSERTKLKTKRLEVGATSIAECQQKHSANLDKVKAEFTARLDGIDKALNEIKDEQLKTSMTVEQLQKDVAKHNGVIDRTYKLESQVAVLENRESVSEHRLLDLEKANA